MLEMLSYLPELTGGAEQLEGLLGKVLLFALPCLAIIALFKVITAKKKAGWVGLLLISGGLSMFLLGGEAYSFVKKYQRELTGSGQGESLQTYTSKRGDFSLDLPSEWVERETKVRTFDAETAIGGMRKNAGGMLIGKAELKLPGMSLQQYFRSQFESLSKACKPAAIGPISFNNRPPHKYVTRRVNGVEREGERMTYWFTVFEGGHHFYSVLQYTPEGEEADYEESFAQAISSFRETALASQQGSGASAFSGDDLPPGVTRQ